MFGMTRTGAAIGVVMAAIGATYLTLNHGPEIGAPVGIAIGLVVAVLTSALTRGGKGG